MYSILAFPIPIPLARIEMLTACQPLSLKNSCAFTNAIVGEWEQILQRVSKIQ